jgi:hypothetical protein
MNTIFLLKSIIEDNNKMYVWTNQDGEITGEIVVHITIQKGDAQKVKVPKRHVVSAVVVFVKRLKQFNKKRNILGVLQMVKVRKTQDIVINCYVQMVNCVMFTKMDGVVVVLVTERDAVDRILLCAQKPMDAVLERNIIVVQLLRQIVMNMEVYVLASLTLTLVATLTAL